MRTLVSLVLAGIVGISITACSNSGVSYVDEKDSAQYTSAGIDYHDVQAAVQKSIQSLLKSEYILMLDKKEVLVVSDVVNDTMQQVDVVGLTSDITRAMRKSGKFEVTSAISGTGGITDNMVGRVRKLRDDDEFNQYTTQEKGTLIAPSLSLAGKIVQKNTKIGKKQRVDYSFLLILTDIKTGTVKWDESTHIIKVAKGDAVTWQ